MSPELLRIKCFDKIKNLERIKDNKELLSMITQLQLQEIKCLDSRSNMFCAYLNELGKYYGVEIDDDISRLYFRNLNNISLTKLRSAADKHVKCVKRGMKFPLICDFIKHLEEDKEPEEAEDTNDFLEYLGEVKDLEETIENN